MKYMTKEEERERRRQSRERRREEADRWYAITGERHIFKRRSRQIP